MYVKSKTRTLIYLARKMHNTVFVAILVIHFVCSGSLFIWIKGLFKGRYPLECTGSVSLWRNRFIARDNRNAITVQKAVSISYAVTFSFSLIIQRLLGTQKGVEIISTLPSLSLLYTDCSVHMSFYCPASCRSILMSQNGFDIDIVLTFPSLLLFYSNYKE